MLSASGLPPMSTFRGPGGGNAPPGPPTSSPPVNGGGSTPSADMVSAPTANSQQTGDALGKALTAVSSLLFFRLD